MGIEPQFKKADIQRRFANFLNILDEEMVKLLQYLGEEAVTIARTLPPNVGFHDRTGNLRGSIGYVLYRNGVAIHDNFAQVLGGDLGPDKGKSLAEEVGKRTVGLTLVIVAGMEYAAALEAGGAWKLKSRRAYDVLTSAEVHVKQRGPDMVWELIDDIRYATG